MFRALMEDNEACKAEAMQSGSFDRAAFDSCMIRKGFQKTGETSYSRTTGAPRAVVQAVAAALPVVGSAFSSVQDVAGKVGAKPAPTAPATPTRSAPVATAPSSGGFAVDTNTLLLFGGAALLLLFAMRR